MIYAARTSLERQGNNVQVKSMKDWYVSCSCRDFITYNFHVQYMFDTCMDISHLMNNTGFHVYI